MRFDETGVSFGDGLHDIGNFLRLEGSAPQVPLREIAIELRQLAELTSFQTPRTSSEKASA